MCFVLDFFTLKLLYKWVELIFGSLNFYTFPSFLDEDESGYDKAAEGCFAELNTVA